MSAWSPEWSWPLHGASPASVLSVLSVLTPGRAAGFPPKPAGESCAAAGVLAWADAERIDAAPGDEDAFGLWDLSGVPGWGSPVELELCAGSAANCAGSCCSSTADSEQMIRVKSATK
jgi:hypothetical protein